MYCVVATSKYAVHCVYTVEPPNNGHSGDEHFVHCLEVVPSPEVEMYGQLMAGGKQFVHCREVVLLSECPLLEVILYDEKQCIALLPPQNMTRSNVLRCWHLMSSLLCMHRPHSPACESTRMLGEFLSF